MRQLWDRTPILSCEKTGLESYPTGKVKQLWDRTPILSCERTGLESYPTGQVA